MIVLAIETTGTTCGVCVARVDNGAYELLSTVESYVENIHDRALAPYTEQVLHNVELTIEDVEVVAVSGGPGSFTGTRIGVAFAKGLCQSGSPKLMIVDTLFALAYASAEILDVSDTPYVAAVIPSHQEKFFVARYAPDDGTLVRVKDDHDIADLLSKTDAADYAENALLVGPGASMVPGTTISGLTRLTARFIARAAAYLLEHSDAPFTEASIAEPLYRQEFVGKKST